MSVELKLTDEQANWLKNHLDSLLDDAHWGRGAIRSDSDAQEHAQTIHDKIERFQKERSW